MDSQTFEMLAGFAHDVRTPLAAVSGYAELLRLGAHGAMSPAQQEVLGRILEQQRRLVALVNAMLQHSAVLAGQLTPHREPVPLTTLTATLRQMTVAGSGTPGVVVADAPEHLDDLMVCTDASLCESMLQALVDGVAAPHAADDGVTVDIHVTEAFVGLIVSGSGEAFSASDAATVLVPFRTRDASVTTLTLPYARAVARLLGGDVHIEPHRATRTLILTLPRAR